MKGKILQIFFLSLWLLCGQALLAMTEFEADMVIINGKIVTADSPDPGNFSIAQAAAIFDGKFIAVGTNQQALAYAGPGTRKIDLQGKTVIPGIVETHDHLYSYANHFIPSKQGRVTVSEPAIEWKTSVEGLEALRTIAAGKKAGGWIFTTPRTTTSSLVELQEGRVTKAHLDQVAPNHPVVLHWSNQSEGLVNTKALDALLTRYPGVAGVYKDKQGIPTGRLAGLAIWILTYEFSPQIPPQELAPYYQQEMEEVAAQGITTFSSRLAPNHLAVYSWLHARGELPLRLGFSLEAANRSGVPDAIASRLVGLQGGGGQHIWGIGDDKLWVIGIALSNIDHNTNIAGSCVDKPYPREAKDFPLWRFQFYGPHGLCTLSSQEYNDSELLRAAAKYGFRISGMHSGGDRGINQYLDLVEKLSHEFPDLPERRWVIDHCRYVSEEQARRAAKLGIIFSCGPKYIFSGESGDVGAYSLLYSQNVAEDVVVPLRRLLDSGVKTTLQLDQHGFHPFPGAAGSCDSQGPVGEGLGTSAAYHPWRGPVYVHPLVR
ncbi:MAG: amidohydrolase family protein [Acidobacteria bacterium]|nr:amidohydrolase family protein [Acidobacteriota bacterium]